MLKAVFAVALSCAPFTAHAQSNNFLEGVRSIDVVMTREETCIASQYGLGDGYHGKRTASGERFNTYANKPYTVAHRTRRLGSFVTITNLANGRSILAKVTDRGPFVRGRCVDLGRAGAIAIGMGGTARVSVQ
jgi:rare lipoprotein A